MLIPVKNMQGESVGEMIELRPDIFEAPINMPLMHQALVMQQSNARQGTHSTKTRGENNRSKAKWYRQKGTGRARHGSRNAPIFVGGGIAGGPKPRSYVQRMPVKMRRAALRSALSAKAAAEQVVVVADYQIEQPKTKLMAAALTNLTKRDSRALVLLPAGDALVERSVRNIPTAKTIRASYLNIRDLLYADYVVLSLDALKVVESILGKSARESGE